MACKVEGEFIWTVISFNVVKDYFIDWLCISLMKKITQALESDDTKQKQGINTCMFGGSVQWIQHPFSFTHIYIQLLQHHRGADVYSLLHVWFLLKQT